MADANPTTGDSMNPDDYSEEELEQLKELALAYEELFASLADSFGDLLDELWPTEDDLVDPFLLHKHLTEFFWDMNSFMAGMAMLHDAMQTEE